MYQIIPPNNNQKNFAYLAPIYVLILLFIGGCGKTNIASIDSSLSCAIQHNFNAPYNKTWKAVAAAVSGRSSIDIIDKDSSVMSSTLATVDGQELSMFDTTFFGQTYKYSYEVVVSPVSRANTRVRVHVRLVNNQFWMIMNREQKVESVESYLRQKLYEEICVNLFGGSSRHCIKTLPCSKRSYRSAPKPAPAPGPDPRYDTVVQSMQAALISAGYNPGPADGIMGQKTTVALKRYQQANGLKVSGRIDAKTKKMLLAGTASPPPETMPKPQPELTPEQDLVKQYLIIEETELKISQDPFSAKVTMIPKDSFVTFISARDDWSKVEYQGKKGYVFSDFLGTTTVKKKRNKPVSSEPKNPAQKETKPVTEKITSHETVQNTLPEETVKLEKLTIPEEKVISPPAPVLRYGVVVETTDIMSKASSFASPIGKVNKGSKVTILETEKEFLKIQVGDNDGYIYADFVDIEENN